MIKRWGPDIKMANLMSKLVHDLRDIQEQQEQWKQEKAGLADRVTTLDKELDLLASESVDVITPTSYTYFPEQNNFRCRDPDSLLPRAERRRRERLNVSPSDMPELGSCDRRNFRTESPISASGRNYRRNESPISASGQNYRRDESPLNRRDEIPSIPGQRK